MKVTKKELDKAHIELTIEIPDERFKEALDKVFKEQKGKINIPGFRKGHAPKALVERHFGKDVFYGEAAEALVYPCFIEALKEDESIKAIGQPEFDIEQLELDKPFIFTVVTAIKQDINLGEYKGIELKKADETVTEAEVEGYLKHIQDTTAVIDNIQDENEEVKNGDIVVFDFVGEKDGVQFEGGTAEDYELTIGSNTFIEGFEAGMIGMKLNERRDLNLTFPTEYHVKDLAGADVVFHVTLNEIKRKELAEIDDEFAKDVSEFETLEAYKEDIKKDLAKQKAEHAQRQYRQQLAEKATADSDVIAPKSLVAQEAQNYLKETEMNLQEQGIELEEYLKLTGTALEDVKKQCELRAEKTIAQQLVLEAIAEKENLVVTDEEIEAEIDKMAEHYKMEKEQIRQVLTIQGHIEGMKHNLLTEKAIDLLLKEAKIG